MSNKYYWLNNDSRTFLARGYLRDNETPEGRIRHIAETAEQYLGIPGFADKFEDYMSRGWYSLASPIWSNFGHKRGLPISCFGSYVDDTTDSILYKTAEVGMMTKMGGGTSGYFGNVRGRGAPISDGGASTGSCHFMELYNGKTKGAVHEMDEFDRVMGVISQGNVRRGSFAAYLPIDHSDIEEFLKIRSEGNPIQEMSFGVCVSNAWMQGMIDGDKDKRKVWAKVLQKRAETGYPYILFSDNVNDQAPQVYKDLGMTIWQSNLCVTGNQRVVSSHGLVTAKELYERGGDLTLFDNTKIVSATPMQLIEKNADVYRITLSNGMSHEITGYHKILISEKDANGREQPKNVKCNDLKIGDRVAVQTKKGLFGKINNEAEAFLLGLYQADGTQHKDYIMLDIWENDFDLIPEIEEKFGYIHYGYQCDTFITTNQTGKQFEKSIPPAKFHDCQVLIGSVKKKRLSSKTLKKALAFEKGYVPSWIWEANEATHWQYLRGLLYADGSANISDSSGNPVHIALTNINKEFLKEIQIIMSNLGLNSSIFKLRDEEYTLLPDGKGGKKQYLSKDIWRLVIGNKNDALEIDKNTGFLSRKNVVLEDRDYRDNTKKYSKIVSIEYIGKEDVFCCTVNSDEHHWVCNGFITHNCTEIMLPNSPDESFVCDLSSMNLEKYDEWKDTDAVETLIYFLDSTMTEFINKTEKDRLLQDARRFAMRHRALGLGVLGWHSFLQSKMVPFDSLIANSLNISIWRNIRSKCDKATHELAELFGEPELLIGYGRRNTTTIAIAPTTSSSFILGQVSPSIEPLNSNYYVKDLAKGKFTYKNPYLEKLLIEKDQNTASVWKSILVHGGSVQHLTEILTDDERDVFKTFGEIAQKAIILQAAQRQPFVDQGQSINLEIAASVKPKEVNELIILAWQEKVKSLYYQRGANPAQQLARNLMGCASCEA